LDDKEDEMNTLDAKAEELERKRTLEVEQQQSA